MPANSDIAAVARLFGQPARAAMCAALLGGQALTATELASVAGVSPATATEHLHQLIEGGVVSAVSQGRHRYHRLSGPEVADVLEGLGRLAPPQRMTTLRQSKAAAALADARTCYDHIAGRLGVDLYDGMLAAGVLHEERGGLLLGANRAALDRLGIDVDLEVAGTGVRPLLRECLDWTERRSHLGGRLGAAVLTRMMNAGWVTRTPRPRALVLTESGERALADVGLRTAATEVGGVGKQGNGRWVGRCRIAT
jgi:DNA-binding transcriptional ArsR family regulator